jgi:hypothetical protein
MFILNILSLIVKYIVPKRKGGIKARRLIAATSDNYWAELFGLA